LKRITKQTSTASAKRKATEEKLAENKLYEALFLLVVGLLYLVTLALNSVGAGSSS
jgi:hypothetical protein